MLFSGPAVSAALPRLAHLTVDADSATMIKIFGGKVDDLTVVLKEERIPEGWEPRYRGRNGLTLGIFNETTIALELGIKVSCL